MYILSMAFNQSDLMLATSHYPLVTYHHGTNEGYRNSPNPHCNQGIQFHPDYTHLRQRFCADVN